MLHGCGRLWGTLSPGEDTNFSLVAETFGGSFGGSALVFVVERFIVDALVDPQE
jgi:hypothetical protein